MRLGQLVNFARFFNGEAARTIRTLEILEAIDRYTRCACGKLQKTRALLGWPLLHTLPEPLYNIILISEATIVGEALPVVYVNL